MRIRILKGLLVVAALSALAACASGSRSGAGGHPVVTDPAPIVPGTMRPYQVRGRWYHPAAQPDYDETGQASWYGDAHNGRPTSTGEIFDMTALTAAHKTLPLPSLVEVTNLANGRRVVLRVNDRGPFVDGRIIDLSRGAADALDLRRAGVGEVRVRYLGPAPRLGGGTVLRQAEAPPPPAPSPAFQPPVPSPAPTPAQVLRPPPAPATGRYWVQAGVFADREAARRVADRLGGPATVDLTQAGAEPQFRVIVGPWPDVQAAERARRAVVSRGYPDALLISAP